MKEWKDEMTTEMKSVRITAYCDRYVSEVNKPEFDTIEAAQAKCVATNGYRNRISVFDLDTLEHTIIDYRTLAVVCHYDAVFPERKVA